MLTSAELEEWGQVRVHQLESSNINLESSDIISSYLLELALTWRSALLLLHAGSYIDYNLLLFVIVLFVLFVGMAYARLVGQEV